MESKKLWKSDTPKFYFWQTLFIFAISLPTIREPMAQYSLAFYTVITIYLVYLSLTYAEPEVNATLKFHGNTIEVKVKNVAWEGGRLIGYVGDKKIIFGLTERLPDFKSVQLIYSQDFDTIDGLGEYILVHQWHLFGLVYNYRIYKK
jgi:hypothetical protein